MQPSTVRRTAVAGRAFVSRSHDPYFNLAWEEYLLRTQPSTRPVCFLYRNTSCVVVGRNQNIWSEVDARAMHRAHVPVVRRRSGGGTVYHDLGNLNFSFHVPRADFARPTHAHLVADALASQPVELPRRFGQAPVLLNERNDLYVYAPGATAPSPEARRKVSGSAYKIASQRAYHHGTLLLHADLARMHTLRGAARSAIVTKAIASVPSPVTNLATAFAAHAAQLHPDRVTEAILAAFQARYGGGAPVYVDEHDLRAEATVGRAVHRAHEFYRELQTWEWVYGSSPDMHVTVTTDHVPWTGTERMPRAVQLHTERGRITRVQMPAGGGDPRVEAALQRLVGQPYDTVAQPPPSAVGPRAPHVGGSAVERAVADWLYRAL